MTNEEETFNDLLDSYVIKSGNMWQYDTYWGFHENSEIPIESFNIDLVCEGIAVASVAWAPETFGVDISVEKDIEVQSYAFYMMGMYLYSVGEENALRIAKKNGPRFITNAVRT